jgi:hypothetical protein
MIRSLSGAALALALAVGGLTTAAATASAATTPAPAAAAPARSAATSVLPEIHATAPHSRASGSGPAVVNPPSTSTNWSGYAATGGTYTSVNSSWVEPAALCTAAGEAAFWVGLDGANDGTVEQTGTTADCVGGSPVYFAWYELFPAAPIEYSDTVAPGDNMSASVTYTGSGDYAVRISDGTRGWVESHTYYSPGDANASAEIIAEAPSNGSGVVPLPDFGAAGFSGSSINGGTLAAANAQPITMVNSSDTPIDMVSPYNSTGNFTVTYGNGGGLSGSPVTAYRSSAGGLWTATPAGASYLGQSVMAGTSPSVAALPGGGFEGAFQAGSGLLEIFGSSIYFDTQLGMKAGTSPSIAVESNGTFEVVFQANTGILYDFTLASGGVSQGYAMASGTSPSITAMPSVQFDVAFQANTDYLYIQNLATGGINRGYVLASGTSPSITA